MFDSVRNNPRVTQGILFLITLPFLFWGMDSYFNGPAGTEVLAKVGDSKILQSDYSEAFRDRLDRLRAQYGNGFDRAMLETPEARLELIESMINQRLLLLHATKLGLTVSDAQLVEVIASIPALQEDGRFSAERYAQALQSQGMTQAGFEAKLRQDLTVQQLMQSISGTAVLSRASATQVIAAQLETREVQEARIRPQSFAGEIKNSTEELQAFYEGNRARFEVPMQLRAEYVVLSRDDIASKITPSEEEIQAAYARKVQSLKDRPPVEERRARHILIQVAPDAPAAEQEAARQKAAMLLARLRKTPGDFTRLAREYSQDPGSAAQGGDLGFFTRETMTSAFSDAVFALKKNQISDLVKTEYGYHIIELTDIRSAEPASLDSERASITEELRLQEATKKFAERAEAFSNMVYEQADSLQPVAEEYGLSIQQTALFDRQHRAAAGLLAENEKLFSALFSEDVLEHKHNTEAVEITPGVLVAARILERQPAQLRPFEAVRTQIDDQLRAEKAAQKTRLAGEAQRDKLLKGESVALDWGKTLIASRQPTQGLSAAGQQAIFKASIDKLPGYAGAALDDGSYAVYRINKVIPATIDLAGNPLQKNLRSQLVQMTGAEDFSSYLMALRARHGMEINQAAMAKLSDR